MRIIFMLAFAVGLVVCFVHLQKTQEKVAQEQMRQEVESEVKAAFEQLGAEISETF